MKVELPKLKNKVVMLGKNASISALIGGKIIYRNKSNNEYIVVQDIYGDKVYKRLSKIYLPSKVIVHFFRWDYLIDKYRNDDIYKRFLEKLNGYGVDKICMMDFSVFYTDSEESKKRNMEANFNRAIFAQEQGFNIVFNFNNMLDIEYNDCFPANLGTIIIDDNHSENKWFYRENNALKNLLSKTKIKDVIFISSKNTLQHRTTMLKLLAEHNVNIHVVPAQWKGVSLFESYQEKYGNKEKISTT